MATCSARRSRKGAGRPPTGRLAPAMLRPAALPPASCSSRWSSRPRLPRQPGPAFSHVPAASPRPSAVRAAAAAPGPPVRAALRPVRLAPAAMLRPALSLRRPAPHAARPARVSCVARRLGERTGKLIGLWRSGAARSGARRRSGREASRRARRRWGLRRRGGGGGENEDDCVDPGDGAAFRQLICGEEVEGATAELPACSDSCVEERGGCATRRRRRRRRRGRAGERRRGEGEGDYAGDFAEKSLLFP